MQGSRWGLRKALPFLCRATDNCQRFRGLWRSRTVMHPQIHISKSSRCCAEKDGEGQERTQEPGLGMISKVVKVTFKKIFFNLFLFMAVLGLCCSTWA